MKIAIISKKTFWSDYLAEKVKKLDLECFYLNSCNLEQLKEINPDWVFFFHWSQIVKKEVYDSFKCVVAHTGVLPEFRGGSPLQNQIIRNIQTTNVNLIKMEEKVDSGAIYCKKAISLQGSLSDIWLTISNVTFELIKECVYKNPQPIPQDKANFKPLKRRKLQSINFNSNSLFEIYDEIRMMDDEHYPKSFVFIGDYKLEFTRSKIQQGAVLADVRITKR